MIQGLLHRLDFNPPPGSKLSLGAMAEQAAKRTTLPKPSAPKARLTCEACRNRKVKCDKISPCTNCQRFGIVCVPVERARLPRGRSGRVVTGQPPCSETNLRDRVSKLEDVIRGMTTGSVSKSEADLMGDKQTQKQQHLCRIYLEYVDPIFKILHRPSVSAFLLEGKPYLDYEPGHPAPMALASAVYYAATSSLREEDCLSSFETSKEQMCAFYQKQTEANLHHADFITTNDLTVLQTYVLSLLASWSQNQSRRVWTMLSMALRIGQALLLHQPTPPFPVSPFEQEMRRRLWHAIGLLDVQVAIERVSEPMMQASWLQSHPPSGVNDDDITFGMKEPAQESAEFTEMSFTLMLWKSQCIVRSLNFSDFMEPSVKSMSLRRQLVIDFQQTTSSLLQGSKPDSGPFLWFSKQVAECINASMQLITIRPLQRNASFTPPLVREDGLLKLAVEVLQKVQQLRSDPRTSPWCWVEFIFVPWHALAVAIAEFCVCQNAPLMECVWPSIEQGYSRFQTFAAGSQQGMLREPMEKLITQARTRRDQLSQQPASVLTLPSNSQPEYTSLSPSSPSVLLDLQTEVQPAMPVADGGTSGLDPLPNVWDVMDFGTTGLDNTYEASWLNYESFIGDLYENADYMWIPR